MNKPKEHKIKDKENCCKKCSGYFEHRVGSHSDDYGGDSDRLCDCNIDKCKNDNCECHKTIKKPKEHTIRGHNPTCLYPTSVCDCGYKEPNWEDQFDERFSPEWWYAFGINDDVNKLGIDSIKRFIRTLLVKKSRRI